MSDAARIEAALRTFHGMVDMGVRKSTGMSIEAYVDMLSRKPVEDDLRFTLLCALSCMKAILDGNEPAHGSDCTIYQHEFYHPSNCTCGAEGTKQ